MMGLHEHYTKSTRGPLKNAAKGHVALGSCYFLHRRGKKEA